MSTATNKHLVIVDDDPQIGDLLKDFLCKHGFEVSYANGGKALDAISQEKTIDLIVLDVMMPDEDGLSICKRLREESNVPVIMLSAVSGEIDRVVGLEVGADDYVAKPFSPRELLARVRALLRRSEFSREPATVTQAVIRQTLIEFDNWQLDINNRQLIDSEGLALPLSKGEYELLQVFLEHPKRTLSRDQLLDYARGRDMIPFDRSIDVQVARLRKKIEVDPKNPQLVITIRGGGYQFTASPLRKEV